MPVTQGSTTKEYEEEQRKKAQVQKVLQLAQQLPDDPSDDATFNNPAFVKTVAAVQSYPKQVQSYPTGVQKAEQQFQAQWAPSTTPAVPPTPAPVTKRVEPQAAPFKLPGLQAYQPGTDPTWGQVPSYLANRLVNAVRGVESDILAPVEKKYGALPQPIVPAFGSGPSMLRPPTEIPIRQFTPREIPGVATDMAYSTLRKMTGSPFSAEYASDIAPEIGAGIGSLMNPSMEQRVRGSGPAMSVADFIPTTGDYKPATDWKPYSKEQLAEMAKQGFRAASPVILSGGMALMPGNLGLSKPLMSEYGALGSKTIAGTVMRETLMKGLYGPLSVAWRAAENAKRKMWQDTPQLAQILGISKPSAGPIQDVTPEQVGEWGAMGGTLASQLAPQVSLLKPPTAAAIAEAAKTGGLPKRDWGLSVKVGSWKDVERDIAVLKKPVAEVLYDPKNYNGLAELALAMVDTPSWLIGKTLTGAIMGAGMAPYRAATGAIGEGVRYSEENTGIGNYLFTKGKLNENGEAFKKSTLGQILSKTSVGQIMEMGGIRVEAEKVVRPIQDALGQAFASHPELSPIDSISKIIDGDPEFMQRISQDAVPVLQSLGTRLQETVDKKGTQEASSKNWQRALEKAAQNYGPKDVPYDALEADQLIRVITTSEFIRSLNEQGYDPAKASHAKSIELWNGLRKEAWLGKPSTVARNAIDQITKGIGLGVGVAKLMQDVADPTRMQAKLQVQFPQEYGFQQPRSVQESFGTTVTGREPGRTSKWAFVPIPGIGKPSGMVETVARLTNDAIQLDDLFNGAYRKILGKKADEAIKPGRVMKALGKIAENVNYATGVEKLLDVNSRIESATKGEVFAKLVDEGLNDPQTGSRMVMAKTAGEVFPTFYREGADTSNADLLKAIIGQRLSNHALTNSSKDVDLFIRGLIDKGARLSIADFIVPEYMKSDLFDGLVRATKNMADDGQLTSDNFNRLADAYIEIGKRQFEVARAQNETAAKAEGETVVPAEEQRAKVMADLEAQTKARSAIDMVTIQRIIGKINKVEDKLGKELPPEELPPAVKPAEPTKPPEEGPPAEVTSWYPGQATKVGAEKMAQGINTPEEVAWREQKGSVLYEAIRVQTDDLYTALRTAATKSQAGVGKLEDRRAARKLGQELIAKYGIDVKMPEELNRPLASGHKVWWKEFERITAEWWKDWGMRFRKMDYDLALHLTDPATAKEVEPAVPKDHPIWGIAQPPQDYTYRGDKMPPTKPPDDDGGGGAGAVAPPKPTGDAASVYEAYRVARGKSDIADRYAVNATPVERTRIGKLRDEASALAEQYRALTGKSIVDEFGVVVPEPVAPTKPIAPEPARVEPEVAKAEPVWPIAPEAIGAKVNELKINEAAYHNALKKYIGQDVTNLAELRKLATESPDKYQTIVDWLEYRGPEHAQLLKVKGVDLNVYKAIKNAGYEDADVLGMKAKEQAQFIAQAKAGTLKAGWTFEEATAPLTPDQTPDVFPVKDIGIDPTRFQYKALHTETGTTGSLRGVREWNENLAQGIMLWRDPQDGKVWVVNGHNRVGLAKELGVETIPNPYFIKANTAEEARSIGALANIADGKGTAIDAAKYFKKAQPTEAELAKLPLTEHIVRDGLALSKLHESLFNAVAREEMPIERAVIIGSKVENQDLQLELVKMLNKQAKQPTNAVVSQLADMVTKGPVEKVTQQTLFGAETQTKGYTMERAEVLAYIAQQLRKDQSLFEIVAKNKATIESVGKNVVDRMASEQVSLEAAQAMEVFDVIKNQAGSVISDAVYAAAKQIGEGESGSKVKPEVYKAVRDALSTAIEQGVGNRGGTGKELPGMAPSAQVGGKGQETPAVGGEVEIRPVAALLDGIVHNGEVDLDALRSGMAAEYRSLALQADKLRGTKYSETNPEKIRAIQASIDRTLAEAEAVLAQMDIIKPLLLAGVDTGRVVGGAVIIKRPPDSGGGGGGSQGGLFKQGPEPYRRGARAEGAILPGQEAPFIPRAVEMGAQYPRTPEEAQGFARGAGAPLIDDGPEVGVHQDYDDASRLREATLVKHINQWRDTVNQNINEKPVELPLNPDDIQALRRARPALVRGWANGLQKLVSDNAEVVGNKFVDYPMRGRIDFLLSELAPFHMWQIRNTPVWIDLLPKMAGLPRVAERYQRWSDAERKRYNLSDRFADMIPFDTGQGSIMAADPIRAMLSFMPTVQDVGESEGENITAGMNPLQLKIHNAIKAWQNFGGSFWPETELALRAAGVYGNWPLRDTMPLTQVVRLATGIDVEQPFHAFWEKLGLTKDWLLDYWTNVALDDMQTSGEVTPTDAANAKVAQSGTLWEQAKNVAQKRQDAQSVVSMFVPSRIKYASEGEVIRRNANAEYWALPEKDRPAYRKAHPELQAYWDTLHTDTLAASLPGREYGAKRDKIQAEKEAVVRRLEQQGASEKQLQAVERQYQDKTNALYKEYEGKLGMGPPESAAGVSSAAYDLRDAGKYAEAAMLEKTASPAELRATLKTGTKPGVVNAEMPFAGVGYSNIESYRGRNDTPIEALRRVLRDEFYSPAWDVVLSDTATNKEKAAAKATVNNVDQDALMRRVIELHPDWAIDSKALQEMKEWTLPTFEQMHRVKDTPTEAMKNELTNFWYQNSDGTQRPKASQYKLADVWGMKDGEYLTTWLGRLDDDQLKAALTAVGRLDGLIQEGFELGEPTGKTGAPTSIQVTDKQAYAAEASSAVKILARELFGDEMLDSYNKAKEFWKVGGSGSMPDKFKPLSNFMNNARKQLGLGEYDETAEEYNVTSMPAWYKPGMMDDEIAKQLSGAKEGEPVLMPEWGTSTASGTTTAKSSGGGYTKKATTTKATTAKATTAKATTTKAAKSQWQTVVDTGGLDLAYAIVRQWTGRGNMPADATAYLGQMAEGDVGSWLEQLQGTWEVEKYGFNEEGLTPKYGETLTWATFKKRASVLLLIELIDFWMDKEKPPTEEAWRLFESIAAKWGGGKSATEWMLSLYGNWKNSEDYKKEVARVKAEKATLT